MRIAASLGLLLLLAPWSAQATQLRVVVGPPKAAKAAVSALTSARATYDNRGSLTIDLKGAGGASCGIVFGPRQIAVGQAFFAQVAEHRGADDVLVVCRTVGSVRSPPRVKFRAGSRGTTYAIEVGQGVKVAPPPPPAPTSCDVVLLSFGERKIMVIKWIRQVTGLGLKEAKAMAESGPVVVLADQPPEAAASHLADLTEIGAEGKTDCR